MIKFYIGNVYTRFETSDNKILKTMHELLSYEPKGAKFAARRLNIKWSGKQSFLDVRNMRFLTGFLSTIIRAIRTFDAQYEIHDTRINPIASIGDYSLDGITLYDYQERTVLDFFKAKRGIAKLATGAGKCLGKDTEVLMYDGTIKFVQDIIVGDLLMGDDSTPRKVLSTCTGREELFLVDQNKSKPYIVNRSHVLSLITTGEKETKRYKVNEKIDISVDDYLKLNKTKKHILKAYSVPVEFEAKDIKIDPYWLGLWLGDGRKNGATICTPDIEVVNYIEKYASDLGMRVSKYPEKSKADSYAIVGDGKGHSKILNLLREYNLIDNKHIPHDYLTNSRDIRLKLLAGILDTDGYLKDDMSYFEFSSSIRELGNQVAFLARSLGFAVNMKIKKINGKDYYLMLISGEINLIPTKISRKIAQKRKMRRSALKRGFVLRSLGEGDYFGFEIDGNKRFLLGDCTVTHNTETSIAITKGLNVPTLFLTHRVNLLHQTKRRFEQRLPEFKNKIGIIGDGIFEPNFITLGTVQTIHSMMKSNPEKILPILKQYQFLIIDEAHRSGAKQFWETASCCENAYYRLALTATPFMKGNAEEDMYLLGITGDICSEVTNEELIDRGIVAKPFFKFFTIDAPKNIKKLSNWHDIYEAGISNNEMRNKIITNQALQLFNMGKTIMIIVTHVAHGKTLEKMIKEVGIDCRFLSGNADSETRERSLNALDSGDLKCLIATNIFDEGISINGINAIILAAGTKSAPALFQRTGRGLRVKKDGNYCVIIDFIDTQHKKLLEHSMRRYNLVKNEKGFTII